MEFDPGLREGPPPRHAIESDSEGSDNEHDVRTAKASFRPPAKMELRVRHSSTFSPAEFAGKTLIVCVNAVGEAYVRRLLSKGHIGEDAGLWVEDTQQGSLHDVRQAPSSLIALVRPGGPTASHQSAFAYLSASLISCLRPKSIVVIDEYYPTIYLSDEQEQERIDPPIRWLQTEKPALSIPCTVDFAPLDAPNYVTGLGAALTTESSYADIPTTLLLMPQGSGSNPHLQAGQQAQSASSVDARPEPLDVRLAQPLSSLLNLTLSPDQQGSGPESTRQLDTFLSERRTSDRKQVQQDISAMYM